MPNDNKGANAAGASPNPAPSAAPAAAPSSAGNPPAASAASGSRPPIDQIFAERGEEIFAHDRFKELTGYKDKYAELEPFVQNYGSVEGLRLFDQHFGPVWAALQSGDADRANGYWSQLKPLFEAVIEGRDLTPLLAAVKAAADGNPPPDNAALEKASKIERDFNDFRTQTNQEKMRAHMDGNYQKYSASFDAQVDATFGKEVPVDVRKYLGTIVTNAIAKYMPMDKSGKRLNPLIHYSQEAFDSAFKKEVTEAFNALKGFGTGTVVSSLKTGSPVVPNTNGNGAAVSGNTPPASRAERAARMASSGFLNRS